MDNSRKIGFWAVVSIVVGSQIGSGIFLLPSSLASFGGIGLLSWVISGLGAVFLALVFSELCKAFPKTGGPHVYVREAFGDVVAFFVAWAYWMISWVSSPAVILAAVGYISSLFTNSLTPLTVFGVEVAIILFFMKLNLGGVGASGRAELVLTVLKLLPVFILPLLCLPYVDSSNFEPFNATDKSNFMALSSAALLTFWGFIGVETATTPAGSVKNPKRTIPLAITLGTIFVLLTYLLCSYAIMGVISPEQLKVSKAPFTDAAKIVFGGNVHYLVSIAGAIVCLGTLNAWILTSGQIALGAANDKLFPTFLGKQNANSAPYISIMISTLGMMPFFIFAIFDQNLVGQFTKIIDASVTLFVVIYAICVLSFLKLFCINKEFKPYYIILGILSLLFCGWILLSSEPFSMLLSSIIVLSGVPIYFIKKR